MRQKCDTAPSAQAGQRLRSGACRGRPATTAPVASSTSHRAASRKLPIFADDLDRNRFLGLLERAGRAIALALSHVLPDDEPLPPLARPAGTSLSSGMHWLNTIYAQWFNRRHELEGHLFEDRFFSEEIESEAHLFEVMRYIPLNPVRAGLCRHPREWAWSSYRATVGLADPGFLSRAWLLERFGRDPERARHRYREFVEDGIERALSSHVRGTGPGTWLVQPKPYVPGKRSARSRTSKAAGRPTTLR